jgi:type IV pilus assembly protein PilW
MLPKRKPESDLKNHWRLNRKRSAGFGLVEIMVAMVIGMFGVMVMMQVLSVSEGQKRATTGGNDAMNEGAMALYAIQSDVRMSGYGITDLKLLGCSLALRTSPAVQLSALAPVVVNSTDIAGQDPNTDTLLVFYGTTNGTPQGDAVNNISGSNNVVQTPQSFSTGDWAIVVPGTRPVPCTSPPLAIPPYLLDKVASVNTTTAPFPVGWTGGAPYVVPYAVGSTAFNQGQSYRAVGYAVRNGNLTTCDFSATTCSGATNPNWTSIADNIVSLRAQYGRDTAAAGSMDGFVDIYDQTTPSTPNTACSWARISAIRFALVARSAQSEKTTVTTAQPVWDGSVANNPAGSAANPINLAGTLTGTMSGVTVGTEWQYYRYKVFQTTVPMRNVSWMGAVAGC